LQLSNIEIKPRCSLGLLKWQEKKLRKLSLKNLKEKGLAWVPKRSAQAQKDDAQASGATKAKERRFKKRLGFAPNNQNYWSWNHPYSLPMPMWNSSLGMHGYPSNPYFDPGYGSLYYAGLPNFFAYQ
jgi:hypothetical protein